MKRACIRPTPDYGDDSLGIDARAIGTAFAKGRFLRLSGPKTLDAIAARAAIWADSYGLGPLFDTGRGGDGALYLYVIPLAEPVCFAIQGQRVMVDFRSSNAGPGYHAVVIALMDDLSTHLSIPWQWTVSDGQPLDETGFATTRDVRALQHATTTFLKQIASIATDYSIRGYTSNALCIPAGLGNPALGVCCPLGPVSAARIAAITVADGAELERAGQAFFPWWDAGLTPLVWQNMLRGLLWQQATWRMPLTDNDHASSRRIKRCRDHMVGQGIAVPDDLALAWQELEACQTSEAAPATTGIGYLKHPVYRHIYASWAMSMPGYASVSANGDNAAYEHAGFWLGTQSLIISSQDPSQQFDWLPEFTEPETAPCIGLRCRKTPVRDADHGGRVQQAMIVSQRGQSNTCLVLTLSSHLDWPFAAFDTWIATVTCPDLAEAKKPEATLH
jgi:hypothetical protein